MTVGAGRPAGKDQVIRSLGRAIAMLDELLTRQTNAILHHPRFQSLEAAWRGLRYLVDQAEGAENVKIRILSVSWKELARDAERAVEFDQSQLFRKVYSEEFDTPGGEPFSVLLGDYDIRHRLTEEHPVDDLATLKAISGVAAAAFAPFVAAAHPSLFGMNEFATLEQPLNLPRTFDQLEYLKWQEFRASEDSRFVGLALPRVLMRLPYEENSRAARGFRFHEDVAGPDRGKYLWGNAVYAFGGVLIRAFAQTAWLADIHGVRRDEDGGGIVTGLPIHSFSTDKRGVAAKCVHRGRAHRPPGSGAQPPGLHAAVPLRRTPSSPPSTPTSPRRSPRPMMIRPPRPTPGCRPCSSTCSASPASPTTSRRSSATSWGASPGRRSARTSSTAGSRSTSRRTARRPPRSRPGFRCGRRG